MKHKLEDVLVGYEFRTSLNQHVEKQELFA